MDIALDMEKLFVVFDSDRLEHSLKDCTMAFVFGVVISSETVLKMSHKSGYAIWSFFLCEEMDVVGH